MSNIKTFEGFLDFFKPKPKLEPELSFEPLSEDSVRERLTDIFSPLANDSQFLMNIQKHGTFHVKGMINDIQYMAGVFKAPFYAGREEAQQVKAAVARNVRQFEYFVADENPSEERVGARLIYERSYRKDASKGCSRPTVAFTDRI